MIINIMNKKIVWLTVIVAIIVVIFDLSKTQPESTAIRVGVSLPLTGTATYYGESAKKGIEVAKDFLVSKSPDLKIELFYEDNQFNPKVAVDSYNKLRLNNIDAVITHNSPSAIAIQPIADKDGVLQLAISASASKYSTPDDLSFRMTASTDLEVIPMIEYLAIASKKIAVMYMNNEIGSSIATSMEKGLKEKGVVSVVYHEGYPVDANDFRTVLTKIKIQNPDSIYVAGLASHIANILKQMNELGVKANIYSFRTGEDPVLISSAGKLAEGVIFTTNFDSENNNVEAKQFVKDYYTKFNEDPNSYSAEAYEALRFIGLAYSKCGKDNDCLKKTLSNVKDYPTVFGNISFNNNGDIEYGFVMKTVKDSKFVRLGE